MTLVLRRADAKDTVLLGTFEQEIFAGEAWSLAQVGDELAGPARYYVVAEVDGVPAGYAGVFLGDSAEIMTIGVIPALRGRGVGEALLSDLLARVGEAGIGQAFLEVRTDNEPAIALYAKHGFERVGIRRGYYGRGVDALVMRRVSPVRSGA